MFALTKKKEVFDGFWKKQKGFKYTGEGHDETEGYLYFEITR